MINNKNDIIELKKSAIKCSDVVAMDFNSNANKALLTNYKDDPTTGVIKRDIIANTYYWLDSHGDVHVGNTFAKSINERSDKIFHLHDHKYEVTAKVGKTLEIKEVNVLWTDLGVNKAGYTTVLMATSEIKEKLNKDVFRQYLDKEIDQHSVGMRYIKVELAVNDEEYEQEYKTWKTYIDSIGNKEKAEEQGFFWAVKEAVLIEYSAVLFGSNELTPTVENKIEPSQDTQKNEPSEDTQIDWNKVINNF
ncbi:MAG TPA: hypothetical protein VIC51_12330 [Psychromonas sp.]